MYASEGKMKINVYIKSFASGCLAAAVLLSSPVRADDDADKLKQLEHAMTAPSDKKPMKTRAIVFDAAPEQAEQPAPQAAEAAEATECGMPSENAKVTAVDFSIRFKMGSAELTSQSKNTLHQIAKILALSNYCVLVEGHTDSVGNYDRNMELSRERASAVVEFITDKAGVNRERLVPVGKGSTEPIKNLNSRNPKNRRVTFKVIS
jgi:outer membrane protein OmpA-like peptidoglycan-associated protein